MTSFVMRMVTEETDEQERRFAHAVRIAEALLFASSTPLAEEDIARVLPQGVECSSVMQALETLYRNRGVTLERLAGKWLFRTAPDLGYLMRVENDAPKTLGRAALETLAVIAYHQPVTRAEIEDIRGVSLSRGTLDTLLEAGFIRLRGRRRTPGKPVTFGTTEGFLIAFGLDRIADLPGQGDLEGLGLADATTARGIDLPLPTDDPALHADEDALEADLFELMKEERLAEEASEAPLDPDGKDVSAERPDDRLAPSVAKGPDVDAFR